MSSLVYSAQQIWWNSLSEAERKPWLDKAVSQLHITIQKENELLYSNESNNWKKKKS